jgi:hypothetical protein
MGPSYKSPRLRSARKRFAFAGAAAAFAFAALVAAPASPARAEDSDCARLQKAIDLLDKQIAQGGTDAATQQSLVGSRDSDTRLYKDMCPAGPAAGTSAPPVPSAAAPTDPNAATAATVDDKARLEAERREKERQARIARERREREDADQDQNAELPGMTMRRSP